MGSFNEYDSYDGLGMAELVRKKDVSPADLYEEAIQRIERLNPSLNAVITPMFDLARKDIERGLPEGPFTGVPFLLKDLVAAYAGVPLTGGSRAYRNYIPDEDCELVKRFKKAGVVIMGKTNCPEFGLMGITEPELHGPTRNPWDVDHTPGGSSGGSAAAVASGMVPIASGGDGGGSLRIPSSCCALFGLKPTRGRNPTGPEHGAIWQGAVVEHIISRSVRDSAAMLDATRGTDAGAPYVIPLPERPYMEEIKRDPGSLRIAFNTLSPLGTEVHPECVRAVEKTALLLEDLGHTVEKACPYLDGKALAKSYLTMYMGEIAADIEELQTILGRKAKRDDVEALTWTLGLLGRTFSAGYFVKQLREWDMASRVMGRFHETYDLYLTPTMAYPPVRIGELQPKPAERLLLSIVNSLGLGTVLKLSGITDKLAVESLSKTPFTQLANFTGQPAMSVPLHWTDEGLPCGVQFIGRFGDEATLFRLAAQMEQAQPWFDRRPPTVVA
ncbi:MAG TPA: amidase family protein [Syntrophales bacterium]|nr:amidase family protein [Syntrophales bacterium]HPQ45012.1 amidase family protein [Syntrophales bacterium]